MVTYIPAFYLTHNLIIYLSYVLTFDRRRVWHVILNTFWRFFLHIFLHFTWHSLWHLIWLSIPVWQTYILTFIGSGGGVLFRQIPESLRAGDGRRTKRFRDPHLAAGEKQLEKDRRIRWKEHLRENQPMLSNVISIYFMLCDSLCKTTLVSVSWAPCSCGFRSPAGQVDLLVKSPISHCFLVKTLPPEIRAAVSLAKPPGVRQMSLWMLPFATRVSAAGQIFSTSFLTQLVEPDIFEIRKQHQTKYQLITSP